MSCRLRAELAIVQKYLVLSLHVIRTIPHHFVNNGRGGIPGKSFDTRVPSRVGANGVMKISGAADSRMRKSGVTTSSAEFFRLR